MFSKFLNFIKRLTLCALTFHVSSGTPVQSHKEFHIYACERCGNLFCSKKNKYK
jgi:hypothetical protein